MNELTKGRKESSPVPVKPPDLPAVPAPPALVPVVPASPAVPVFSALLRFVTLTAAASGILAAVVLAGCGKTPDAPDLLVIGSWNVQTLFDGEDNGSEYDEYRETALWNEKKYRARLNILSGAIQHLNEGRAEDSGGVPDLLALIEIENLSVLEDIAAMPDLPYRWLFFAGTPGAPLGLGVLSRFPIRDAKTHAVSVPGGEAPRPVAEFWLEPDKREALVLMVCHWKSKLGGGEATETARQAAAAVISRRLGEIEQSSPGTQVIILGDLNENHDELVRTNGAYLPALIADSPSAAVYTAAGSGITAPRPGFRDFLILSGGKPPVLEYLEGPRLNGTPLFSPWMEENNGKNPGHGSYYYQDQWETIDHFLLNPPLFDGAGWEYDGFKALNTAPFTNAAAVPEAFNPRTGGGLSDHLPIILSLRWTD
ncbi:MAG: endonuclease/exonuclease/phosphatase family protein [Treponema sp.]|nr:endonuclease/exonuclease/phosphatase family protein [Treponema sp.]